MQRKSDGMSAVRIWLATALVLFFYAPYMNSQINPEVGRALSIRLHDARLRLDGLNSSGSALEQYVFQSTIEGMIISRNLQDCGNYLMDASSQIHGFSFDDARKSLDAFDRLSSATETIIREDKLIPIASIVKISALDDFTSPQEVIPDLRGPSLRAFIYNEISYSKRVTGKASWEISSPKHNKLDPSDRDACTDEQDVFFRVYFSPDTYYAEAGAALRLLDYEKAHNLAYRGFADAQNALRICSQ